MVRSCTLLDSCQLRQPLMFTRCKIAAEPKRNAYLGLRSSVDYLDHLKELGTTRVAQVTSDAVHPCPSPTK